jgi:hypothetical protein
VKSGALAWLSAVAVALLVLAQWLLATMLAWASGVSDAPAPSLAFDWKWVLPWLLPEIALAVGLAVSWLRWRSGHSFRTGWSYTLALGYASLFVLWLLYAITDQRTVRGVPRNLEDWTVELIRRITH